MRIERLFNILLYLLNHQKVTAAQLSEVFQVSKRTIYRDIDTLSPSGVPLFTVLGVNGGIQLMENYRLNRFTFSESEKNILIQSLNTQHTLIETDKATELVYKINLLQEGEQTSAFQVNFTEATLHRGSIERDVQNKLSAIQTAMSVGEKIQINYIAGDGTTTKRIVQPLELLLKDGSWYLSAYCELRKSQRLFKLTRIRSFDHLPLKNDYLSKDDLMVETPNLTTIELQFEKNQLGKLYDYFLEKEMSLCDTCINVRFKYDSRKNILPFLLMFGSNVKVIAPIALKNSYQDEVKKMNES